MGRKVSRYKKLEKAITAALCVNTIVFIAYLIFAGCGQVALKIISMLVCFAISGGVLYFLYVTRELLRKRSLWMTLAAACILICVFVSLILNFPSPRFTLP